MAYSGAIYAVLRLNASVLAKVGSRIYGGVVPSGASLPCVIYNITSLIPTETKDMHDVCWDNVEVTITAMARTYAEAEELAGYIRTAMSRYDGTQDSTVIRSVIFQGLSDGYDELFLSADTATGVHSKQMNFSMIVTEA